MERIIGEIPIFDYSVPVVFLPVRHHSPACAFHVTQTLRRLKPAAVLIEGPHDATPLIPLLTHPEMKPPVAIFTTCVLKKSKDDTHRFSAYYPICDYSPELAAVRIATEINAECAFIDLSFSETVDFRFNAGFVGDSKPDNLLADRYSKQNRFIESACLQTGTRDADDLWDRLYELDYRYRESDGFFRNILAYCTLLRKGQTSESLIVDGTEARETSMFQRIKECSKRHPGKQIAIVSGGFHTVAFLNGNNSTTEETSKNSEKKNTGSMETQIALIRYGFEQLDRLNGYASGMSAPEFYQRDWDGSESFVADLVVELGRICRKKNFAISTADEIAALHQLRRLTELREHPRPSREDFCDAIRSVFVKGADDSDGLPVLALCRKMLAGNRIGQIPKEAGQPPIVEDFQRQATELRVPTDSGSGREITLDLYRKRRDRAVSRFFRQLEFLAVPFADWKQGPNFLSGEELHRIREIWNCRWTPETESSLITRSIYGSTLREAASELLLEKFKKPDNPNQSGRADHAVKLLVSACLMGLHDQAAMLLDSVKTLIAEDALFVSLVRAMELLIGLHVSQEPLEAHDLTELDDMALSAYRRACFLIPELAATSEGDEETVVDALCSLSQSILTLGDAEEHRELRWDRLRLLAVKSDGNPVIRGATVGLLYGDGKFDSEDLLKKLRGELHGSDETAGPDFLYGLLKTARSVLWQLPECVDTLQELLRDWDEDRFVKQLPLLRLAFSSLTPRECDRLAKIVADRYGLEALTAPRFTGFTEQDMLLAARLNLAVKEILQQDGLF